MEQEEKKEGCKSCKKGFSSGQRFMIVFSIYLLLTEIYGNVVLFKQIISMF